MVVKTSTFPMYTPSRGPTSTCVIALMLHAGYSGYVALSGFGVSLFRTSHFGRYPSSRAAMLVRLLKRLLRQEHPVRVVLGIPPRDTGMSRTLRHVAKLALTSIGATVTFGAVKDAYASLGYAPAREGRARLAHHLVRHFVPELADALTTSLDRLWQRRPVWHALALALRELLRIAPFSFAALATAAAHRLPGVRIALNHALAPAL